MNVTLEVVLAHRPAYRRPSSSGIIQSRRASRGPSGRHNSSTAARPFLTAVTSYPAFCRVFSSRRGETVSSSAIRILIPTLFPRQRARLPGRSPPG